ncbi:MAG TPA: glycoside hydrolase family 172 protein, partial [Candidatus Sulfotelmatobacter sp.]|nr:glycoside hydrolase family 172 protein [Candidatus Sulfotelmatobacter sp.]
MRRLLTLLLLSMFPAMASSQDPAGWVSSLPQAKDYIQKRASSYDRSGANADFRPIAPGETLTLLDDSGPGLITHVWVTIASDDPQHLKALVLRMYWDGEFMPMPFQKHARITVTNEGAIKTDAFYFNVDYRAYGKPLSSDQLYFHAQYRQESPARGWSNQWKSNGDAMVNDKKNLNGEGNYVWMEASGRGHFVGVSMSVLQNQDGWWGEGDDMFFVDGEKIPSINGTGSEDYFLGAWDFGGHPFSYALFGAPVVGEEV